MPNSILSIGKTPSVTESKRQSRLVYSDINMESRYSTINTHTEDDIPFVVERAVNVNAINQAIRNIFTWIRGERILNPMFGTNLRRYLYEGITIYNQEKIVSEINRALMEFEPRVRVDEVVNISTIDDTEDNTIHLQIRYSIPSLTGEQFTYDIYNPRSV